jgi:seryl-tRNA synthetase
MIDIKFLRENTEIAKENLKKKFQESKSSSIDKVLELDVKYRDLIKETNELKHKRNKITEQIKIDKTNNKDVTNLIKEAKELPSLIKEKDEVLKKLKEEIDSILIKLPTIISPETIIGKDESFNKEIKRYGPEPKAFDFDIKNHAELADSLNIADFDSSRDVSGKGFYFLKGDLTLLNTAIFNYARDKLYKKGYIYVLPPLMINKKSCEGVIDFDFFKDMVYKIQDEDLYLISTSEHPLIAMFMNKTINSNKLPIKVYSFSTCFRKEIGSHGLDERGLFRLHQFDKVEQIIICNPKDSIKYFDELLNNTIEIFEGLEVPIRTLEICTGDLGNNKYRQIDIEVWSPRQEKYIEAGSCSNLWNSQATGLKIRVKDKEDKYYVHTLNNTAIANSRALVAILENNQTKDGIIKIPKVLVPYMYGKEEIKLNNSFF